MPIVCMPLLLICAAGWGPQKKEKDLGEKMFRTLKILVPCVCFPLLRSH